MTKEEIMDAIHSRRTYVTFTPYTGTIGFNRFTTVEFTKKEILKKIDNARALEFLESLSSNIPDSVNMITFDIGLGLVVDSSIRKNKTKKPNSLTRDDFLEGLAFVTIAYANSNIFKLEDDPIHRTKSFLVELDSFVEKLQKKGWSTTFVRDSNVDSRIDYDRIVEQGLHTTPTLISSIPTFLRYRQLRKDSLELFLKIFYPNVDYTWDSMPDDIELDLALKKIEEFIATSTEKDSPAYSGSPFCKVMRALSELDISLDELSTKNLNAVLEELKNRRTRELKKHDLSIRFNSYQSLFHEGDPAKPSIYTLSKLFYLLNADIKDILDGKGAHFFETNYEDFLKELENLTSTEYKDEHHVQIAISFLEKLLNPNIPILQHLVKYPLKTEIETEQDDQIEAYDYITAWLTLFIKDMTALKQDQNPDDYGRLVAKFVFEMQKKLTKKEKSMRFHPEDGKNA